MVCSRLKALPYGISDYAFLRDEDYVFVDKTKYIELLEQNKISYPFIVRPRRFGKTLFTGLLRFYYDIAEEDNFDKNFAGTYIGAHKTRLANSYRVLSFDFSGLNGDDIVASFTNTVRASCKRFLGRYPDDEARQVLSFDYSSPADLLDAFMQAIALRYGKTLYVIIDEYDQFANEILSADHDSFREITKPKGFLKNFYSKLKAATGPDGAVARVFITGVTTVSLDSMSSGFNIATDLTNDPLFADMFGFTEAELKALIPQVIDPEKYQHTVNEIYERMQELYDGYSFSQEGDSHVFNSSMSLYYLRKLVALNKEPLELLDPAFAPDLTKISGILALGESSDVKEIIDKSVRGEHIPVSMLSSNINLNSIARFSKIDLLSALFCFGYLTWADDKKSLKVPNRTVEQQFFRYYLKYLNGVELTSLSVLDFEKSFESLKTGDPRDFIETAIERFNEISGPNIALHMRESDICTALAIAAGFSRDFRPYLAGEITGREKGYTDLVLTSVKADGISYVIEAKYLTKKSGTAVAVERKLKEAQQQLKRYSRGNNIAALSNLKCVACVFVGLELKGFSLME